MAAVVYQKRSAFPFVLALCALPLFSYLSDTALADESLVVLAKIFPADGQDAQAEAWFRKLIDYVRAKEPDITYRLHRTDKPVRTFMFYEVYPSQAAFEEHRKNVGAFSPHFPDEAGILSALARIIP